MTTERFQGQSDSMLTAMLGIAFLTMETNLDLLCRLIGLLAVASGIVFSTMRFLWDMQDRKERRELARLARVANAKAFEVPSAARPASV